MSDVYPCGCGDATCRNYESCNVSIDLCQAETFWEFEEDNTYCALDTYDFTPVTSVGECNILVQKFKWCGDYFSSDGENCECRIFEQAKDKRQCFKSYRSNSVLYARPAAVSDIYEWQFEGQCVVPVTTSEESSSSMLYSGEKNSFEMIGMELTTFHQKLDVAQQSKRVDVLNQTSGSASQRKLNIQS